MSTRAIALAFCMALALAPAARAQRYELTPEPKGEKAQGYLQGDAIGLREILGPYPVEGSLEDQVDVRTVQDLQASASPERFAAALQDQLYLFPSFTAAYGAPLDREHMPVTTGLLRRALADAVRLSSEGKDVFRRIRPYQRLQLKRVCGLDVAPDPKDNDPKSRTSYPSGHTTVGWTTALVLAEIEPGQGPRILARARDYGLSRQICGFHWPSDVEAGRAVATAVFARLKADPAFRADVDRARAEYAAVAKAGS